MWSIACAGTRSGGKPKSRAMADLVGSSARFRPAWRACGTPGQQRNMGGGIGQLRVCLHDCFRAAAKSARNSVHHDIAARV
jgi:hypothetical protein